MRILRGPIIFVGAVVLLHAFVVTTATPAAEKVTGEIGFWNNTLWASADFQAHESSGTRPAKGRFYYQDDDGTSKRHYEVAVNCVSVAGPQATFSGQVIKTNVPIWESEWVQIWVDDGGTPGRKGDRILTTFYGNDPDCSASMSSNWIPVAQGNLVVHSLAPTRGIIVMWEALVSLYAISEPSPAELTAWFNTYVADDFLDDHKTKAEMLNSWIAGDDAPPVGFELTSMAIVEPLDLTNVPYLEGYVVRLCLTFENQTTFVDVHVVYDGTGWLWYGDQRWVSIEFLPGANMDVDHQDIVTLWTGLWCTVWDDHNVAYNRGVRSGIVSGPGLPEGGLILEHYFPLTWLRRYPKESSGGGWQVPLDDGVISTIPDNAEYTISLYAETADQVSLNNTPLWTYKEQITKRPVLNAELSTSLFPTLIWPDSHDSDQMPPGGTYEVRWENTPNISEGYWIAVFYWDGSTGTDYMVSTNSSPGDEAATLDCSTIPSGVNANGVHLQGRDSYGRAFGFGWSLRWW